MVGTCALVAARQGVVAVAAKRNTISTGMARPARIKYLPSRQARGLAASRPGSLPW
jgi:hypothetical protein